METRILDFEHVYIAPLNEGSLPSVAASKSLIPYSLRKPTIFLGVWKSKMLLRRITLSLTTTSKPYDFIILQTLVIKVLANNVVILPI
ncbi:MAG: hypothetical protein IPK10_18655 [Bacteroidetes bacterium]|nr:hypothetical protein [Bacteroidota bacterium]